MKTITKFFFLTILFIPGLNTKGQSFDFNQEFPETFIDVGAGVGPNYGMAGARTIIGYKGSGLLMAVGTIDGFVPFTVGFQFTYKYVFVSLSRGAYRSYKVESFGRQKSGLVEGSILMFGGRANLMKKKVFIEFGVGFTNNGNIPSPDGRNIEQGRAETFSLGLNYRL